MSFASVSALLAEIRGGRMVVLVDDEDRENEGDLVMAASMVKPDDINFMARFGRGLICLSLTRARCDSLGLRLMVDDNRAKFATNFTVSIEAAEGVTTGISAYDRAHTIQTAVSPNARARDLAQPGHIFPLMSQPGGVLTRAGHTEASVDLACLAGLEPAGVICEILNDDGSMARRDQLIAFAQQHGLLIGTIADLIKHRLEHEKTVFRAYEGQVETSYGTWRLVAFRDVLDKALHFAMVKGEIRADVPVLTRVHVKNPLTDVLHLKHAHASMSLVQAMQQIQANEGPGVLVILNESVDPDALLAQLRNADSGDGERSRWRRTGLGAQILADLGARRLRVLGRGRHHVALSGFELEVLEYLAPAATT